MTKRKNKLMQLSHSNPVHSVSFTGLRTSIWNRFYEASVQEDQFDEGFAIWKKVMNLVSIDFQEHNTDIKKHLGKSWNLKKFYLYQIYVAAIAESMTKAILHGSIGDCSQNWLEAQISFQWLDNKRKFDFPDFVEGKEHHPDLFRRLYENILPTGMRKILGEFQTPSWLAKELLRDLPIATNSSICDPSCGVGTFLVEAIQLLLGKKQKGKHSCPEITNTISRVSGFDLNPLAVTFARFNLLAAYASSLCPDCVAQPMPIYFADTAVNPFDSSHSISPASDDRFTSFSNIQSIPIRKLSILEDFEFLTRVTKKTGLSVDECQFVLGSARAFLGRKFEILIGNPPWIAWDGIRATYRQFLSKYWKFLFTQKGWRSKVAAGRVDLSEIIVYSAQRYLASQNATMCFLLPESVFKSSKGGEGFRKFQSPTGPFSVTAVLDFTSSKLFPYVSNRFVCAYFKNNKPQAFPVPWVVCSHINPNSSQPWAETEKVAYPLIDRDKKSPWMTVEAREYPKIRKMIGKSHYRARGGINTGGGNPIFWVRTIGEDNSNYLIENIHRSIRMEVRQIQHQIEPKMLRPLIRGRDIEQWKWKSTISIIVPYLPEIAPKKAIIEEIMENQFPQTLAFFRCFKTVLENRKEYIRWGRKGPWYRLFRIGPYTFSKYKVIWRHTGVKNKMRACVVEDNHPVVDQKVILVPFDNEDEAHYFCALVNSSTAFSLLSSYLLLDASTHILEYLAIGKFDPTNLLHKKLADFSKKAHRNPSESKKLEIELDQLSGEYWAL
ncbi:MAG: Eco57I restriction-modification methylase domain-containing protein [Candidatus Heimdallarchaeota archaeon]